MGRHSPDVVDGDHTGRGYTDEDIGPNQAVSQGSMHSGRIRVGRDPLLHGVHVLGPAGEDCTTSVATNDVVDAARQKDLDDCNAGGADAVDHNLQVLEGPPTEAARVDQRTEHHHGGAMLVVVEDGNVEPFPKPFLNLEASWCADVLEVDASERGCDAYHRLDDLVGVLGIEADGKGVDASELLEQHRLAFHDRHRSERAEVAKAQDRRAVTDHRNGIALDRKGEGTCGVLSDGADNAGDTRRVGHGQIVASLQGRLRSDLDLAPKVHEESSVGHVHHRDAVNGLQHRHDCLAVAVIPAVDGDIARQDASLLADDVDCTDVATSLANRGREATKHSGPVLDLAADDDAVACARSAHSWLRSTDYGRVRISHPTPKSCLLPTAIPVVQGSSIRRLMGSRCARMSWPAGGAAQRIEIRGRWGGAIWRTIVSGTLPTPMRESVAEANPSPWFRVRVDMPLFWETSMVVGFRGFAEE